MLVIIASFPSYYICIRHIYTIIRITVLYSQSKEDFSTAENILHMLRLDSNFTPLEANFDLSLFFMPNMAAETTHITTKW